MKKLLAMTLLLTNLNVFSHDEGHGPAITDESVYGGKVTAIIHEGDVNKGRKADMVYKAELVYESRKPAVKLYLFDKNMKALDLTNFAKTVNAVVIEHHNEQKFSLALDKTGKFYTGSRPLNKRVPFNIDVKLKKGNEKFFGAFDGLD
jgi:hypothetical protein